jgi:hypothetical protein
MAVDQQMIIRDTIDRRDAVTYSDIIVQLELEYGVCLQPGTLRRVPRRG